jgi:glycosyltransferase involved in cell wall biosynthesis
MDDQDIYERSALQRAAPRVGLHRAAAPTACSGFALLDAQRFGLRAGEGQVVFNGVRLNGPERAVDSHGTAESLSFRRYVLALGRAVDKKGFDLSLRAFAELHTNEDVGLVIGGDGVALSRLRDLTVELGVVGQVYFPGRLGRARVAELMRGAEVFVMPSRRDRRPRGVA